MAGHKQGRQKGRHERPEMLERPERLERP